MTRSATFSTVDTFSDEPAGPTDRDGLALTILAHPDAGRIGEQAFVTSEEAQLGVHRGYPAFEGPLGARPLDTRHVSRQPLLLGLAGPGGWVRAGGDRPCTVDGVTAFEHPVDGERLAAGVVLRLSGHVVLLARRVPGRRWAGFEPPLHDLVGPSPALRAARDAIARVGPLESAVLIRGETGTGKERVAEALHASSRRARRPCVAVNLAAIPAATAPSQLFGHARGAFTGADVASGGLFGEAEGGTLFLDEIGEAPVELQAMLLRAIDAHEVQRVGGGARRVDVRIVAATDAPLEEMVASNRFRAALFHRLAGATIALAPLRDRPEDVAVLLVRFLREALGRRAAARLDSPTDAAGGAWLGADAILAAIAHSWPGNVRELRAAAQWMALHSADEPRARLPPTIGAPAVTVSAPSAAGPPSDGPSTDRIRAELERHEHRLEPAARALGMSRNTLRARMRELGLRRAVDLTDADIAEARARVGEDPAALAAALGVGAHALRLRLGGG